MLKLCNLPFYVQVHAVAMVTTTLEHLVEFLTPMQF
jgi:hypothetical protein